MEKREKKLRTGALSAVVAALGDQKELIKFRDSDRSPRLELREIKAELDEDISNEVAYLRDAGIVSTESFQNETVEVKLNPEFAFQASEMKDLMYEEFNGSLEALAASSEYMKFEAPDDWPLWEGPERNDLAQGSVDYRRNMGALCAVMSLYGEERLRGANITEYSTRAMEDQFSLDEYEVEIDLEKHLQTLERLGYVERHSKGLNDIYRLADNQQVKRDAKMIAEYRDKIFSGYPQNMAFAYEEADRVELSDKGVKLVERPEKQLQ
ncbi:hypothetical protein AQV86_01465 [Nanohaloarchaea archaeon SG9]|nr:hypothetical protein AQV86_01465 [Nanohaloarchaea archaeon SG9]